MGSLTQGMRSPSIGTPKNALDLSIRKAPILGPHSTRAGRFDPPPLAGCSTLRNGREMAYSEDARPDDAGRILASHVPTEAFATGLKATARMLREAGSDPSRHEGVRSSLRVLSRLAHQDGIPPERFVVELKAMMRNAMVSALPIEKQEDVRNHLVRLAIEGYYDDSH